MIRRNEEKLPNQSCRETSRTLRKIRKTRARVLKNLVPEYHMTSLLKCIVLRSYPRGFQLFIRETSKHTKLESIVA